MFTFTKLNQYTRQDIWKLVKGNEVKMSRNFQQSGYERIDEDLFAFINIGYKGHAGQIFPNKYDEKSEMLHWYGKKETHSKQPLMKSIIDGFTTVYCFARWNNKPEFTFLGIGQVISYKDDFKEVFNKDGSRGNGFIECHHNIPLHNSEQERITKTRDLSLLCSNCHRMIHRKKKWLTVQQLKDIYSS